jgi:hypothetical protein
MTPAFSPADRDDHEEVEQARGDAPGPHGACAMQGLAVRVVADALQLSLATGGRAGRRGQPAVGLVSPPRVRCAAGARTRGQGG